MLTITRNAAEQILRASLEAETAPLLRVAARRMGDGSIDYGMGFDEWRTGDIRIICEGVAVLVAPPSRELLDDVVIDYVELAPGNRRFIFEPRVGAGVEAR